MKRIILDTSVLIRFWQQRSGGSLRAVTPAAAADWGQELIKIHDTDAIVTPVYLEMIAGVRSQQELRLTRAYLGCFRCIDGREIPAEDWREALRLAQRVPRDSSPRGLGDCLIRAIANRLKHSVQTLDQGFPH